tara:strand:+ start:669 stop:1055 length:387 start_codon:yes stop_codon:yes gene_type:complete
MKDEIKISTNKSFGIVFFFVFIIIGLFPALSGGNVRLWSIVISVIFLILGLLNSKILSPLNKLWFRFGIILGRVVSPLVMGFVFFLVVTPIGLFMRIIGRDLLNLKFSKKNSYWLDKDGPKSKMKNQF